MSRSNTKEQEQSPIDEAVALARLSPSWFVQNILRNVNKEGEPLNDPWLDELLEAIADLWRAEMGLPTKVNHELKNQFSVRSGHGPGKTYGLAQIMHYVSFCWQTQTVCIAPKEKLVLTRLWPRFRRLLQTSIAEYRALIEVNDSKIIWCGDRNWAAIPETAREPEALAGYHTNGPSDWLILMLDETSGIREDFFPVIYGAMSQPHTILVMISNPTQTQGEFYKSHRDPRINKEFYTKHIRFGDSRYTDAKWAERMRLRYGENSPVYQVRVLGEFVEMAENQLISLDWLNASRVRPFIPDGSHKKLRVSVDVADGGLNETSISAGEHYESSVHLLRQQNYSFPQSESPILAAKAAIEMFEAFGGDKKRDDFVVDANGVGAGTAGYLIDKGYIVVSYRGGHDSDDSKQWRNRRVQSHLVFRNALRDGWLFISDQFVSDEEWDEFTAQCCAIRRKPGIERVEDIETKADMLARGVVSPDRLESAIMQFATQAPTYGGKSNAIDVEQVNEDIPEMESARAIW